MSPLVSYVAEHGFDVEFATTAEAGLRMAGSGGYGVILLDLKLPDADGLDVLDRLRAAVNRLPVIVITGHGSMESALIAGRCGAAAYKSKPLRAADLLESIRSAVASAQPNHSSVRLFREPVGVEPSRFLAEIEELETAGTTTTRERSDAKSVLSARLVRAVARPELTLVEFSAVAKALRSISPQDRTPIGPAVLKSLRDRLHAASLFDWPRVHRIVQQLVVRFEAAGKACLHVRRAVVAREFGVDQKVLSKQLGCELGESFPRLRRLVVVRRAVQMIVTTDEQVSQVGFTVGYESLSAFDRAFASVLGTSPRQYRQLVRTGVIEE